jgi:hypothetical protein
MTSAFMNDAEHWRKRAEQAHRIAGAMTDPQSSDTMRGIAKDYETLAERAAERLMRSLSK